MAQQQMEQFLGKFNEKLWWILSYRHAAGAVVGGFSLSRIGQLLGGGWWMLCTGLLGVILGVWLMWTVRGQMRVVRLATLGWFFARQAVGRRVLDPAQWGTAPTEATPQLELTFAGGTMPQDGGPPR